MDSFLTDPTRPDRSFRCFCLYLYLHFTFTGLFSLDGVVERLRELLPATFEELDRDFACAVLTSRGEYIVLDSGPLPEAVAASAAIPFLFAPVHIPGRESMSDGPFQDGKEEKLYEIWILQPARSNSRSIHQGRSQDKYFLRLIMTALFIVCVCVCVCV